MKKFNTTGLCIPKKNYMVDLKNKIYEIVKFIEDDEYFTINRARQFGKTTIINELFYYLKDKYLMIDISFEGLGDKAFSSENEFCESFINLIARKLKQNGVDDGILIEWEKDKTTLEKFEKLSDKITILVKSSEKEVVLIIDEVDKSSDNQLFLNFLGMLRAKYLDRNKGMDKTFKSVILAGVYDVKNLKLKLKPNDEKKYNSPWNIATDFNVDMAFNCKEISTMIFDYENDANTGMDVDYISQEIYKYTSGYPFLVSYLCKVVDETGKSWNEDGLRNGVKEILSRNSTLFDDMIKNLENNIDMYNVIYDLIVEGKEFSYNTANPVIARLLMFSIIDKHGEKIKIHNKIFENYLYNYLISKVETSNLKIVNYSNSQFIDKTGNLIMERILNKFQELMKEEYRDKTEKFLEREGRLIFLAFMKPIINGKGYYFVETQTRNNLRMDVVITINNKQYIIELKKWYGKEYEEKGYNQLAEYLEIKHETVGYLIMFDFRKTKKEYSREWLYVGNQKIYEVVV